MYYSLLEDDVGRGESIITHIPFLGSSCIFKIDKFSSCRTTPRNRQLKAVKDSIEAYGFFPWLLL